MPCGFEEAKRGNWIIPAFKVLLRLTLYNVSLHKTHQKRYSYMYFVASVGGVWN